MNNKQNLDQNYIVKTASLTGINGRLAANMQTRIGLVVRKPNVKINELELLLMKIKKIAKKRVLNVIKENKRIMNEDGKARRKEIIEKGLKYIESLKLRDLAEENIKKLKVIELESKKTVSRKLKVSKVRKMMSRRSIFASRIIKKDKNAEIKNESKWAAIACERRQVVLANSLEKRSFIELLTNDYERENPCII